MNAYYKHAYESFIKDEVASKRTQIVLPLLCGIVIAFFIFIMVIDYIPIKDTYEFVLFFFALVFGFGTLLWNIHFEDKHTECKEKIKQLKEQIANDE